jgi:hypothetical protein
MNQSSLFPIPVPPADILPDSRHTDPHTSAKRGKTSNADIMSVIDEAKFRGTPFIDDDVAYWTGKPRNVAAKIRQQAEKLGWIVRTGDTLKNDGGSSCISFIYYEDF